MVDLDKTGKLISDLRKNKDLTQSELAKELHITPQAISKWENGLSLPDTVALLKLADFFQITTDEILRGELCTKKDNQKEVTTEASFEKQKEVNNVTEIFVEGKRKVLSLEPEKNTDIKKNIKVEDESLITVERNGKIFHYKLEDPEGKNEQKEPRFYTKDKKQFYYNYDFTRKDSEDEEEVLSIHQLIGLAPFMSQKSLEKLINRMEGNEFPLDQILALAPFLNQEKLNELTDKMIEVNDLTKLSSLFPFLSSEKIEELLKKNKDLEVNEEFFTRAAPFLKQETLLAYLSDFNGEISIQKLSAIAPFISSEKVEEIALENFTAETQSMIESILPFISESGLDKLSEKAKELGIQNSFINNSIPFLSKKAIASLIDSDFLLTDDLDNLSCLAPHLDREQMQTVLLRIKSGKLPKKAITIIAPFLGEEILDKLVDDIHEPNWFTA